MKNSFWSERAQVSMEYLLIIAGVVVVAAVIGFSIKLAARAATQSSSELNR
jgi:uncharacterized protein (UPF0333 family)